MDASATVGAVAVVRQFYGLLGEGKPDEALALLRDDVVVRESPGLPFGGDYHGRSGFLELAKSLDGSFETDNVAGIEFLQDGNTVVLQMTARFTERTSRRVAETAIVEVVTVADGQIAEIDVYYKDPAGVAALVPAR
jgi:hypothetical protein